MDKRLEVDVVLMGTSQEAYSSIYVDAANFEFTGRIKYRTDYDKNGFPTVTLSFEVKWRRPTCERIYPARTAPVWKFWIKSPKPYDKKGVTEVVEFFDEDCFYFSYRSEEEIYECSSSDS